ncbi:MAG: YihY/virulence factor BrkB family protein [Bacteroidota bacterium]
MVEPTMRAVRFLLKAAEAVWFYARGIGRKVRDDDILFLSAGLAFNGLLTMIPLMLLSASALGIFLNTSDAGMRELHQILDTIFPPQPFAVSIKESILTVVADIIAYRTSLGIFGVVVLVWTATSLFDALRSVLHVIYGLQRTRGLFVSILRHVGFVFLVFLLFLATTLSLWVLSLGEGIAARTPALAALDLRWLGGSIPTAIIVALTGVMFYIIYRHIPDSPPPKAAGLISTLTTTAVWIVSGKIFALYLSEFSAIGKIYGAYAFLLVLLVWVYYSSIIFVFGGMVGQIYWERLKLKETGRLERWV